MKYRQSSWTHSRRPKCQSLNPPMVMICQNHPHRFWLKFNPSIYSKHVKTVWSATVSYIYIYKQQFAIIRDLRRLWPAIYEIDIKSRVFQEFFKTLWSWGKLLFEDGEPLTFPEFMDAILTLRGSNQTTVKDRMGHARCCNHQPAVLGIIQYRFSWELKKIITVFTGNSLN